MGTPPIGSAGLPAPRTGLYRLAQGLVALALAAFVTVGVLGTVHYIWGFWLYRGFPPPQHLAFVVVRSGAAEHKVAVVQGEVEHITVRSAAVGDKNVPVIVYLPPHYAYNPGKRYPVLYLLHGFPGSPAQFINVGDAATLSDTLVAEGKIEPMIVVMPQGTTNFFVDTEWANSLQPNSDWETFVARDLVGAIDSRYRTIPTGAGRGIGGLSEGAYAALNIAFHHPGEFDFVEAWSPYFRADHKAVFFEHRTALLAYNSPNVDITSAGPALRRAGIYVWMYCGTIDYTTKGARLFASQLAQEHIPFDFSIRQGRHTWALWRSMMPTSLEVASAHLHVDSTR